MSTVGSWDDLTALSPDAAGALSGVVAAAWDSTDPALLELARLRIAKLLGHTADLLRRTPRAMDAGLSDEKAREVASWPTSPRFTARERACLAFTEQFVIDANGVTDEMVAEVSAHLGAAGCYAFAEAVSVLETYTRACLVLGIDDAPEP
jgi:alkylhydroperoxidase family enzyme